MDEQARLAAEQAGKRLETACAARLSHAGVAVSRYSDTADTYFTVNVQCPCVRCSSFATAIHATV